MIQVYPLRIYTLLSSFFPLLYKKQKHELCATSIFSRKKLSLFIHYYECLWYETHVCIRIVFQRSRQYVLEVR